MYKYVDVMVGADPELFFVDNNGNFRSAIDKIGGNKINPRRVDDLLWVQEDNVAVEFNIQPARTKEEFVTYIQHALKYIETEATKYDYRLGIVPAAVFPKEELKHPAAQAFGCEPDYNVWTQNVNSIPKAIKRLRSCGGHIHVSWSNPVMETQEMLVRALDVFCGIPSIRMLWKYPDLIFPEYRRRSLYGKAGAFRFKDYGIEYRTLSNFWLASTELIEWVWHQTMKAINFLNEGGTIELRHKNMIQKAINKQDISAIEKMEKYYGV